MTIATHPNTNGQRNHIEKRDNVSLAIDMLRSAQTELNHQQLMTPTAAFGFIVVIETLRNQKPDQCSLNLDFLNELRALHNEIFTACKPTRSQASGSAIISDPIDCMTEAVRLLMQSGVIKGFEASDRQRSGRV